MGSVSNASPRRFDVLQKRLDELTTQQAEVQQRLATYGSLTDLSSLLRISAIHSEPISDRLSHLLHAPSGQDLRSEILEGLADLPPTSGGIANTPFATKIGIISDLFLYKSFERLADFKPIYPHNYQQHSDIDVLLLVSTWKGIDGISWKGVTARRSEQRELLFDHILPFYRDLGIPIVFYSKEDPPNYAQFLPFAQQADYIFTSAEEMVERYRADCPQAIDIETLSFGINPKHHSPIGSQQGEIQSLVPFAGSWFNHKYPDRARWGGDILDAVVASDYYDLLIFDRNSELHDPRYRFPNRYANTLTPAIDHQTLLDIQRRVDISVNLNSVSDSSSMFANRAIELQAQGTVVLSNYNVALNSRYPHVHISNGFTDTLAALNTLTEGEIRAIQAAGIRSAFSHELALMRISKILSTVGLSASVPEPRVAILKHSDDAGLQQDMAQQTYPNIVETVSVEDVSNSQGLQDRADVVVHVDTHHEYAPTHVEDLVNSFRYTDARAVEKFEASEASPQHATRHTYTALQNQHSLGAEYIGAIPRGIEPKPGYRIDDIGIRKRTETIEVTQRTSKPAILSVVVPIYNNGPHLLYKCIASLRRSSIFDQMEIILVDDGSTDPMTIHAIEVLERELVSAPVYRFEPGGSGSASRPRNKGLELASCDYVTYLDPDNEALNDAYVKLLHVTAKADVDFAVGDMTRWRGDNSPVRYTKFLRDRLGIEDNIGEGGPQALVDMEFMPISIQAIVARTEWLRGLGITQPVGAVGQDSYFFQQMLYYADKFAVVPVAAHTYYAQVENSVVNTVNAKFFDKYLPLESARSQWLTEVGLLESYKALRMETFFTGWYLRKLKDVPEEQRSKAIATVEKLGQMYGAHEWQSEEALAFWKRNTDELMDSTSPTSQER